MRKNIYEVVGDRIREERKRAGLTIEQLAESTGISTSFLAYIETKKKKASLETIEKLAKALEISIADLFKTIPNPKKDFAYDAFLAFAQLIKEHNPNEIKMIINAVKTTVNKLSHTKNKK